jgi:hypothetical protein
MLIFPLTRQFRKYDHAAIPPFDDLLQHRLQTKKEFIMTYKSAGIPHKYEENVDVFHEGAS